MAADFRAQDLQQHRIDDRLAGLGRRFRRRLGDCGCFRRRRERRRFTGGNGGSRLGLVGHVFAGGQALGGFAQTRHVDGGVLAQQGFLEARQHLHRDADHGQHGAAGRTRTVEHAVQQAFDFPAELAQGLGADQTAAALERVEHAPDRAHQFDVVGIAAPIGIEAVQVRALLGEFLEENLADLVVDAFGLHVETGHGVATGIGRRHHDHRRRGGRRRRRRRGNGRGHRCDGGRNRRRHGRSRRRELGHRPVMQGFQALFGDVEDALAVRAAVAHGFQVVLDAGQHFGQALHLLGARDALALDQFDARVGADGVNVVRDRRVFQDGQGAGHLLEQTRNRFQLLVVPVAFDEGDERLADLQEVDDRLADQRVEQLVRLRGGQELAGHLGLARSRAFAAVLVEHRLDRQQRFGDLHQLAVAERAAPFDVRADRLAVLVDVPARAFGVDQRQRVFDAGQHVEHGRHVGGILIGLADRHVQAVLDLEDVLLDHRRDAVEQGVIAAEQAALGVPDLVFVGHQRSQFEGAVDFGQTLRGRGVAGHEVQQLLGDADRRQLADLADAAVVEVVDLLVDLGQRALQGRIGGDGAAGHGVEQGRSDPEQLAVGVIARLRGDAQADFAQVAGGLWIVGGQPTLQMGLELQRQAGDVLAGGRSLDAGQGGTRQRMLGRRGVYGLLAQGRFAADRTQLVDQRQQHRRHVAVAVLQSLQVIRQLHDALHQQGVGAVAARHRAVGQSRGQLLHFLGQARRAGQFDHAQRARGLVQMAEAFAQRGRTAAFFGEAFERGAGLLQRAVQLGLEPGQDGDIDGTERFHAEPWRNRVRTAVGPLRVSAVSPAV